MVTLEDYVKDEEMRRKASEGAMKDPDLRAAWDALKRYADRSQMTVDVAIQMLQDYADYDEYTGYWHERPCAGHCPAPRSTESPKHGMVRLSLK